MGLKLQLLCVLVVFAITIQQASSGGCYHGQHDPPDPAKSHKLPCKRPDALIHCPCPNCDQEFENAEQMQQHIDYYHPDCYYCRREGIGGRGPDSPVSCRCEEDDDHYFSDGDFTTAEPPYSSGEDEPEDGMCTLGMCEHYKHQRPMWSHYDSRRFRQLLDYYIRKVDSNAPRHAASSDDSSIEDDEDAASRIRVAEACFEFDNYENRRLQTGSIPSQGTSNYQEGVSSCANSLPSTSNGITGCCGRGRPLWFRGKWTPKPKQTGNKKGQKRLETCFTEANPTSKNRNKLICIDLTSDDAVIDPPDDGADSDDSVEFVTQTQNNDPIPVLPVDETILIPSDDDDDTIILTSDYEDQLGHPPRRYSTTTTTVGVSHMGYQHHSSSTQGPSGSGMGGGQLTGAVGGVACYLMMTTIEKHHHRHPRMTNRRLRNLHRRASLGPEVQNTNNWRFISYLTQKMMEATSFSGTVPPAATWTCSPLQGSHGLEDFTTRVRPDNRCGFDNLDNFGRVAICSPMSAAPCCSKYGFCGGSFDKHCHEGTDFRKVKNFTQNWRFDGKCGYPHLAVNGELALCPHGKCCSLFGFCGFGEDYCRTRPAASH